MRLFVSVEPPAEVREHLDRRLADVRESFPRLRWIPPERWHLTTTFLGEVDVELLPELGERLGRAAARTPPVSIALTRGGRFDGRVLLVHVEGDVATLRRLAERTTAAARRTGVEVEERRYRPHLTVARASRSTDLRPAVDMVADYAGPVWTATDVALVSSTPGSQGVETAYRTVATFPLGGDG